MNFGKRFQQWRQRRRTIIPDEAIPLVDRTPEAIPESDAKLLKRIGFIDDSTPLTIIGRGTMGTVWSATANKRALRYHSITNIRGEYYANIFEGKEYRYLPVSDTIKVTDKYYVESLVGRVVAIKFVHVRNSADPREQDQYRREAHIMSILYHPNIVKLYDIVIIDNRRLYIIMEYCPDRSLNNFLLQQQRLSERLCLEFVQQLTAGLLYLHGLNIMHGDIHGNNIMLVRSEPDSSYIRLKYVDFGVANFIVNRVGQVKSDLRMYGSVLNRIARVTNFDDQALRLAFQGLCARLLLWEFESLDDAVREFEFLWPEEHTRL